MKRNLLIVLMSTTLTALVISGCSGPSNSSSTKESETKLESEVSTDELAVAAAADDSSSEDTLTTSDQSYSSNSSGASTTSFTNKYGTPTTKCAHPGCNNYIASSGDTNCCTVHSNRCLECGKYIDEDALYCMDDIEKAAKEVDKSSGDSSYSSNNYSDNSYSNDYSDDSYDSGYGNDSYGNNSYSDSNDGYGYDSNDPYYSSNDHDHDGKINDQEFQDAMNDYIDDVLAANGY